MAGRCGSFSRSLLSTARRSSIRSSQPLPRLRPPPLTSPPRPQHSRQFSFSNPRTLGEIGCIQSLLPLHSVVAESRLTSHLSVNARAFCQLSQGT